MGPFEKEILFFFEMPKKRFFFQKRGGGGRGFLYYFWGNFFAKREVCLVLKGLLENGGIKKTHFLVFSFRFKKGQKLRELKKIN